MTEAEWLACVDPDRMQEYLRRTGTIGDRKFRLFGCACCRRIWDLLDDRNRQALEVVERFADGLASEPELQGARKVARQSRDAARSDLDSARHSVAARPAGRVPPGGAWLGACAILHSAGSATSWKAALNAADSAAEAPAWVAATVATGAPAWRSDWDADQAAPWTSARKAARTDEERKQAGLLRHMVGSSYHPYTAPSSWPTVVVRLGEAIYNGADAGFALHDALLEAGHPDLAEHFQQEQHHPKGCWVVDLILEKI